MICERVMCRKIKGEETLGQNPLILSWIGELAASLEASRALVLNTALLVQEKGGREAGKNISLIKFFVANMLDQVLDKAIQVHGSLGVSDDTILSYFYREERAARIYDGPDEIHKISLAKKLLKEIKNKKEIKE